MILPRSHTWMHLLPSASRYTCLAKYRGPANLSLLIGIYRDAIAQAQSAAVNQFPVEATA